MKHFMGVVEDRNDPRMINRVRVRCFGYHTADKNVLPTEHLPWATVVMPNTSPGTSGLGSTPHFLVEGSWVVGFFRDESMQDPIILGSVASLPTSTSDGTFGFQDPNGIYPKTEYIDISDVNIRAREGDENATGDPIAVGQIAFGPEFNVPASPFAPVYPFNKVYESEAGHIIEVDDTDGAERLKWFHVSGTYKEIYPGGEAVEYYAGSRYIVTPEEAQLFYALEGNMNISAKNYNLFTKEQINMYATEQVNVETEKEIFVKAAAQIDIESTDDDITLKANNINLIAETTTVDGNLKVTSSGDIDGDLNVSGEITGPTISELQSDIAQLQSNIQVLVNVINSLESRVSALEAV